MPGAARLLCLGDSYTIGEGVPVEGRWPQQLCRALAGRGIAIEPPQVVATTGWTTDELAAGLHQAAPQGHFDLVTLAIGVNDQYRRRPLAEYASGFAGLLDSAIALAGARPAQVLVLSIPDWGVTPFAATSDHERTLTAVQLHAFNDAARAIAQAAGSHFCDLTTLYRQHAAEPAMLADDGLHPSAAMYALWVDHLLPLACPLLEQ